MEGTQNDTSIMEVDQTEDSLASIGRKRKHRSAKEKANKRGKYKMYLFISVANKTTFQSPSSLVLIPRPAQMHRIPTYPTFRPRPFSRQLVLSQKIALLHEKALFENLALVPRVLIPLLRMRTCLKSLDKPP